VNGRMTIERGSDERRPATLHADNYELSQ
jgi:hypothetical protein